MNRDQKQRAKREKRRAEYRAKHKPKTAKPADPRWNLEKDRGREVTVGDVKIYARPMHEACRATGMIGETTPCKCAATRFFKANKDRIIMDEDGLAWWIAGKEPNAPKPAEEPAAAKRPEDEA